MENLLFIVLVAAVVTGAFLYLCWKVLEALDDRRLRREGERRYAAGQYSLCRVSPDGEGGFVSIRIAGPKR